MRVERQLVNIFIYIYICMGADTDAYIGETPFPNI